MDRKVELIYDRDCPNVEAARAQLRKALAAVGAPAEWQEWDREAEGVPQYARRYGSPTILVDERDVEGEGTESDSNCCRVYAGENGRLQGVPPVDKIVDALRS